MDKQTKTPIQWCAYLSCSRASFYRAVKRGEFTKTHSVNWYSYYIYTPTPTPPSKLFSHE